MSSKNCFGCYRQLEDGTEPEGYHKSCSRRLFGTDVPPLVDFGSEHLEKLAKDALNRHLGITGVQPKVSVELERQKKDPAHRLMIVGLWGGFILKPPSARFPDMPVVEDATMHMAEAAGITTALHGLIKLKSGELAYVTRRFDREKHGKTLKKVAVEDFCQLSGLLTDRKYKTSMEKAGKIILNHASNPGLDAVTFFDLALFSFLTGNADMHLKNFSLMTKETGEIGLAPAYDLISTRLMPIEDAEETALTINGKKARLSREDFEAMGETLKIQKKAVENSFERLDRAIPKIKSVVSASFLSTDLKNRYEELIRSRAEILRII
ncbi:MAG: HipA domain-containing protein [Deltaproteobacteria bacterium]|nr:HipA domain-containing protein [Deltaproteobacteria bacterium]